MADGNYVMVLRINAFTRQLDDGYLARRALGDATKLVQISRPWPPSEALAWLAYSPRAMIEALYV